MQCLPIGSLYHHSVDGWIPSSKIHEAVDLEKEIYAVPITETVPDMLNRPHSEPAAESTPKLKTRRGVNRDRILDYIFRHGPSSTGAIAAGIGIPSSSVSSVVNHDSQFIREGMKWAFVPKQVTLPEVKGIRLIASDEPANEDPLNTQVGGGHYKGFAIQPAEFIHRNNLGFLEGCIVKRVCRHKTKNKAEDLKKAIHELQILLKLEYGEEP